MTVIELRELLSGYDDEVQVFMKIESIVDNYGNYICINNNVCPE